MKRASIRPFRQTKNLPTKNLYQSSRSHYLRAFASARAMRFWRPRLATKKLTVAAVFTAALAISPSEAHAQFGASIDLGSLEGTSGFVINGIDVGAESGHSVSNAGDVNGDGIDDVIIGAHLAVSNGNIGAGESYVVFGNNSGFVSSLDLSTLDGTNGFAVKGIDSFDFSGTSVSGAGDVNGDGIDDLIIGAFSAEPNGNVTAGESYVVFGSNSGFASSLNLSTLNGTNGFVINGIDVFDRSGGSVAGAGDVNGDGIDDLIIGASGADPNGNSAAGESYVVFGSTSGFSSSLDLSTLDGTNGFVLNGIDEGDASGRSVSGAGDVNGDGFDDLIIGGSYAEPNGSRSGESYVVFGTINSFSPSLDLSTLNGSNGFVINGIGPIDYSGLSVSGAGDVNGDGFDDLIIGASSADPNGNSNAGQSYVILGSDSGFSSSLDLSTLNGANGFVINGIDANDFSGASVSGAGDVNGDGVDDVVIGARNGNDVCVDVIPLGNVGAGESYVVFGNTGGFSPSLDLSTLNGSNGFVLNGIDVGDDSGFSVSGAGDVNGDGIDDLIIGANRADPNGKERAGESYVVFGRASVREPIIGDVNQDGEVNFLDIAPFISLLSANGYLQEADINQDGAVDFFDISPFIDVLASQE